MNRMRIYTVVFALALLVTLAGCNGASKKDEPAETSAQTSAVTPEKSAPEGTVTPEKETVVVSNADEFLKAIEPGAVIELAPGIYNLTECLRETSGSISEYVARANGADGGEAEIQNVTGLTIRGAENGKVEVVAEPRYCDVLHFNACSDITIENITFGHTVEQGTCEGAVLAFEYCYNVSLNVLDLYGCGTYGVEADHTVGMILKDSVIRDCSYGIIDMLFCSDVSCEDCTFKDNRGFDMLSLYCSFALFDGCTFTGNEGSDFLPLSVYAGGDSGARFENCTFGRWESQHLNEELKNHGNYMIGKDCQFDVAVGKRVVHVSNVEQLIENIAPDTQIMLAPGKYNLSDTLVELFTREGTHFNESHEFVRINEEYDGLELVITGVSGLTIASESGLASDTEIVTDPRYADVMNFENSSGIGIMNLTMGHTETGDCSGNVLYFTQCNDTVLYGLDLYGCGVYGIGADECGLLSCFDSTIRDCENGTLELYSAEERHMFINCVMTGSGSGGYFSVDDGEDNGEFYFFRCTFGEMESNSYAFNDNITVADCIWSDITAYPDYSEESDEYDEPVALDTARLKVVPFDTKVLSDEHYYICYEVVDKQSGDVNFEPDSDMKTLTFEEDGTGYFLDNSGTQRPFKYAMDSDYSCVLSFDDGGEANLGLYAEQDEALPGSNIWLALYLNEETLWFY